MWKKHKITFDFVIHHPDSVWCFFFFALLFSGIVAILRCIPQNDVVCRYAPAAEAFARGDWQYAFHPRFGVFFTSCAGIVVWLFGVSGITACKVISVLSFSLAVFPLYALFDLIFGRPVAFWGTFCYVFCSHLLRYAGEGWRDNGKTLAMALIALALVSLRESKSWKNVVMLATGGALLAVIRGEGILIAFFCGIAGVFLLRDWKKSLAAVLLFAAFITPQCIYNYRTIGFFVPELRHGVYLYKLGIHPADAPVQIPEEKR